MDPYERTFVLQTEASATTRGTARPGSSRDTLWAVRERAGLSNRGWSQFAVLTDRECSCF